MHSRWGAGRALRVLCASSVPLVASIFSGSSVNFDDYPYFATLVLTSSRSFSRDFWVCGSTLIHESFVLTAGHCTKHAVGAFVYLNSTVSLSPWVPGPAFFTTEIFTNPSYDEGTIYNDLGLVKLPYPMRGFPKLTPAVSASDWDSLQTCALVDVLGRGHTCNGGCLSNVLRKTELPKVPYEDCTAPDYADAARWAQVVVGADLCLGFEDACVPASGGATANATSATTCPGDSGGPAFVGNRLLGVVSRGPNVGCGAATERANIFVNLADELNRAFIVPLLGDATNNSALFSNTNVSTPVTSATPGVRRASALLMTLLCVALS